MKKINIKDINQFDVVIDENIDIQGLLTVSRTITEYCVKKNDYDINEYDENKAMIYLNLLFANRYTNIELNDEEPLNSFNKLFALDILPLFEENKYFQLLVKFFNNDVNALLRENKIENVIAKQLSSLAIDVDNVAFRLNKVLDKVDPNIIIKYLSPSLDKLVEKVPYLSAKEKSEK
mgnify:CR=1 FL=1